MRILLVEDNDDDAFVFRKMIAGAESEEFVVTHCRCLSQTREIVARESFDVALLDLGLPESQGCQTLTTFAAACPDLPVVVLTGADDQQLALDSLNQGAQDYLVKGRVNAEVLVRSVRHAIERQRLLVALRHTKVHLEERTATAERHARELETARTAALKMMEDSEAIRRQLREKDERMSLALSSAQVGTWDWDADSNVIVWDDFMHPLFGIRPGDFDGTLAGAMQLIHPEDRERVEREVLASVDGDGRHDSEFRVQWSDGTIRHLAFCGTVYRAAGEPLRMIGVCIDITERKQAAQALYQANQMLREQNEELRQFAHIASHDLKAPLRTLTAFSEMLVEELQEGLNENAARYLQSMRSSARNMQVLIDDLLAYSRAGRNVLNRTRLRTDECVDQAISALDQQIQASGAKIHRDALPSVQADRTMLVQLYQNLIANALKFVSGPAPELEITSELVEGSVVLGVRDNGIGIKEKYFDRIFEPFKRLHCSEKFEGSGIGLAICKKVVQRHGGRIWVESQLGNGAHFLFTLEEGAYVDE